MLNKLKRKLKNFIEIKVGGLLIRLVYLTNRYKLSGFNYYQEAIDSDKPVIIALWHGRLMAPFMYMAGKGYYGLAGTHKDAELISQIGQNIGWNFLRGSSSDQGREAYQNILKILQDPDTVLFITPDGPKGPAKKTKPGAIRAAMSTGAIIIPVASHSTRYRGFTNWDTFVIAKAFARTEIIFGPPLIFTRDMDFEECALTLETELNKLEKQVDEFTGN